VGRKARKRKGRKGEARKGKAGGGKRASGQGERPLDQDRAKAEEARRIADRAIKRLNVLEYLILLAAVLLALLGGAVVAWALAATVGLSFRASWAVASLLLFIIPGGSVYLRELRRGRRETGSGSRSDNSRDIHG